VQYDLDENKNTIDIILSKNKLCKNVGMKKIAKDLFKISEDAEKIATSSRYEGKERKLLKDEYIFGFEKISSRHLFRWL
jgi:hypothetical protein